MSASIIRELGDDLVLRRATPADAETLAAFNGWVHRAPGASEPNHRVMAWTRDLLCRPHPTFHPEDFTIVEDTRSGSIVSSLNLISQTWEYEGIRFGVGRPELVGTRPDFRGRGLVRTQFEVIHQWSAERGERLQAITGIPYFYRQFGYEMALELEGWRTCGRADIPPLRPNQTEPYRVRPAVSSDLSFIAALYDESRARYVVSCVRDGAAWAYELGGRSSDSHERLDIRIIETTGGEPVGFLVHEPQLRDGNWLVVRYLEIGPGFSWVAVIPSAMRALGAVGEELAAQTPTAWFAGIRLGLGSDHPAYRALEGRLGPVTAVYAWYVRVPDLADFLRLIAPALERRLASSIARGHDGELRLDFYRSGIRLVFERGRLTAVEDWLPRPDERGDVWLPDLTFLQLLFGYRSLSELEHAFADCGIPSRASSSEARALVEALFPRRPSFVWPIS
ncbi:MAG: GNAT family N-acetyltransferase [Chloroflexi bacterium]|nr:GNAT family N-acetyltransferase [Chloroflexota bacterium]